MKPTLLILICCLLCAGVRAQDDRRPSAPVSAGNPAAPAAGEAPEAEGAVLRLAETLWNVGDVPRKGGDVTHDFRFRNEGTEPLVVLRVITSCSCVKASFPKRPVAPGGEGVIRITYQPHKSEPGTFHKVIRIQSNAEAGDDLLVVQGCAIEQQPRTKVRDGKAKVKYK